MANQRSGRPAPRNRPAAPRSASPRPSAPRPAAPRLSSPRPAAPRGTQRAPVTRQGLQSIQQRTGQNTVQAVRSLRADARQAGQPGGNLLTGDARQKFKTAKARSQKVLQQPRSAMGTAGPKKSAGRAGTRTSAQPNQNLSWQTSDIGKYATGGEAYGGSFGPGVFDAAAWMRARNLGGFTDEQIKDYLAKGDTGLYIGKRPQAVIENWATQNPELYTQYVDPTGENKFGPARVMFNPLGSTNIGIGRGGLQDQGISWYTSSDLPSDNQTGEANLLENSYYMNTPEGMARVFEGESPVPTRYMGDPKTGQPSSLPGSKPFGYDTFTSPSVAKYWENLKYKGSWLK